MGSLPGFSVGESPANLSVAYGEGHYKAQNVGEAWIYHATGGRYTEAMGADPAAPPAADVVWHILRPLETIPFQVAEGLPTTWVQCQTGRTSRLAMEAL